MVGDHLVGLKSFSECESVVSPYALRNMTCDVTVPPVVCRTALIKRGVGIAASGLDEGVTVTEVRSVDALYERSNTTESCDSAELYAVVSVVLKVIELDSTMPNVTTECLNFWT